MSRREATQTAIMRSVECLAAENGLENISIRDILARAGQKNESALQYHFKNLSGLLAAIRRARAQEVAARRQQYLEVLLDKFVKSKKKGEKVIAPKMKKEELYKLINADPTSRLNNVDLDNATKEGTPIVPAPTPIKDDINPII